MFTTRDNARTHALRTLAVGVLACAQAALVPAASPGLTVFAPDGAAAGAFVQQLRATQTVGEAFDLVRVADEYPALPAPPLALDKGPDNQARDTALAGVRTRGRHKTPAHDGWAVAVGPAAAREAISRPNDEPLVLAMLSRVDYDRLKDSPALQRGERRIGVLLREVSMREQLALIDAALPEKRRLGVVSTPAGEAVLRELREAADGWDLQVEIAPDANSIGQALRALLPRSDALIVLPDLIGDDPAATQALLHSAAGAGVPVFGSSEALVRSGGLAAVVATAEQQALQARALGRKLAAARPGVQVETPAPVTVRVNATVAQGLGLRLPSESELDHQVGAGR